MISTLRRVAVLFVLAPLAHASEPGTPRVPKAIVAIEGCWAGKGDVMEKAVTVTMTGKPIVQNAMVAVDAESRADGDPTDTYAAHLLFGGADKIPGAAADQIVGFWADSFGGAFTASGHGASRPDGFDISYQYGTKAFINRWRVTKDRIVWRIVSRSGEGQEKAFANYDLHRVPCAMASRHTAAQHRTTV